MIKTTTGGVTAQTKRALGAAAVAGLAGLSLAPAAHADEAVIAAAAVAEVSPLDVNARQDQASSPKIVTPLRDTPQTIAVVPSRVIREQNATTLRDVLRNVPGISIQAGEGGVPNGDALTVRGFSARTDILIDGVRDIGGYTRDSFNLEQVEVAKGPASAYAGRGSTGGSINQVSKSPHLTNFGTVTASAGTDDYLRATADLNWVLDEARGVAARLNVMGHRNDTPGRDHVYNRRWGVAPSIAFGLGSPTTVTASLFHQVGDNLPDYGLPWVPDAHVALADYQGQLPPVDPSTWYGIFARDFEDTRTDVATVQLRHEFSPALTLNNVLRYGETRRQSTATAPRLKNNATTVIYGEGKGRDSLDSIWANQTNLTARFATGAVNHAVTAGLELAQERSKNTSITYVDSQTTLVDPDPNRAFPPASVNGRTLAVGETVAVYAFDTIELTPQWRISTGLRHERFDLDYQSATLDLGRVDEMTSGRFAVVYKPVEAASIYFGYSTAFSPSAEALTLSAATEELEPEETRSYELGFKWDLPSPRMQLAGALFRSEKVNARTPGLPGDPPTVLAGEQRIDGVELGLSGMVTPGWTLSAGYTWMDGEILKSNTAAEVGKTMPNTPEHSFSLWSTYEVGQLTVGGGASYVGERFANATNTRMAPEYWSLDAMAAWRVTEAVRVQLNAYNLADEEYLDNIGGGHVVPGPRRSAVVSLSYSF